MSKENEEMLMIAPAFERIRQFGEYLPAVNGVLVGSDLTSIKMLEDIRKILTAKDVSALSHVLHYEICDATQKQIGFSAGYEGRVSIIKLKAFLDNISKAYKDQARLSVEELKKVCKKQEMAILQQENEKQVLNEKINELLDMAQKFALRASDKARITARKTKKDFDKARDTIMNILKRRRQDTENPEPVDVEKLERVSWGQKEEYYR